MIPENDQMDYYIDKIQPLLLRLQNMLSEAGIPWVAAVEVYDHLVLGGPDVLVWTANVGDRTTQGLQLAVAALRDNEE
jgi:hypothetical protein